MLALVFSLLVSFTSAAAEPVKAPECNPDWGGDRDGCEQELASFVKRYENSRNPLVIREVNKALALGQKHNFNNPAFWEFQGFFTKAKPRKIDIREVAERRAPAAAASPRGQWVEREIVGTKDGRKRRVSVYLPAEYRESKEPLPIVYYFHGYSMSPSEAKYMELDQTMDFLRSTGITKPFVLVAPDLETGFGVDAPGKGKQKNESFLLEDVMPTVEKEFRVDTGKRMAIGNSMGGFVSLNLASKHPGLFKYVSATQPMLFESPRWLESNAQIDADIHGMKKWQWIARQGMLDLKGAMPDANAFAANNPIENLAKLPPEQRPHLYISTGDKDDFRFHEGLTALQKRIGGDKHTRIHLRPGDDHDWQIVAKGMLSSLIEMGKAQGYEPQSAFGKFLVALDKEDKLYPIVGHFVNNKPLVALGMLSMELKRSGLQLGKEDVAFLKRLLMNPQLNLPKEMRALVQGLEEIKFGEDANGKLGVKLRFTPMHCALTEMADTECEPDRILIPLPTSYASQRNLKAILEARENMEAIESTMLNLAKAGIDCETDVSRELEWLANQVGPLQAAIVKAIEPSKGGDWNPYIAELEPEVSFAIDTEKSGGRDKILIQGIDGVDVRVNAGWPLSAVGLTGFETDGTKSKVWIRKMLIPVGIEL